MSMLTVLGTVEGFVLAAAVLALGVGLLRRSFSTAAKGGFAVLVPVALLWSLRTAATGHIPIFGAWESAVSLALASGIALLISGRRLGQPMLASYPVIAGLLLLHGGRYSREIWGLTISERGFWVHLHAILAFAAFALAMCLFSAAVLVLAGRELELRGYALALTVFYALNIVSGSFYRVLLLGSAWSFDPIEAMNLAAFLALTTLVHLMSFTRLSPRRAAMWSIVCVVCLVFAYRLILVFPAWSSYHILDIDLRTHIVPG